MDWIKIKLEHLSPEFSNAQLGALLRFQAFIARFGRYPTDIEIRKEIGKKDLINAELTLSKLEVTLKYIQSKVEEDREEIESKRNLASKRKRKQREQEKMSRVTGCDSHKTDKSKGDNSKEEEIIVSSNKLPDEEIIAKYFYDKILTVNPNHKKPNLQSWAKDIDKMIRIDKRTDEQIKYIIDWLYAGSKQANFWRKNILSTSKLREKFDQLIANIKEEKGNDKQTQEQSGQLQTGLKELAEEWGIL